MLFTLIVVIIVAWVVAIVGIIVAWTGVGGMTKGNRQSGVFIGSGWIGLAVLCWIIFVACGVVAVTVLVVTIHLDRATYVHFIVVVVVVILIIVVVVIYTWEFVNNQLIGIIRQGYQSPSCSLNCANFCVVTISVQVTAKSEYVALRKNVLPTEHFRFFNFILDKTDQNV